MGAFQSLDAEYAALDGDTWITPNAPNPTFIIDSSGEITGDTSYELVAFPVEFKIIDETNYLENVYIQIGPYWDVNNYCDKLNGNVWSCILLLQP